MSRIRFAPRRFAGALYSLALTVSLTISISLHAQVAGTGTIQGTVTDPTGAFLPGATVTLTEEATHVVHTAKTDSAGAYVFPNIVIGTYTLTVADPASRPTPRSTTSSRSDPTSASTPTSPSVKQADRHG